MKHLLRALYTAILLSVSIVTPAQTITWADQVACIVYSHCTSCHHDGGIGPYSLLTYADVYDNRNDIAEAVGLKVMPPWPPDEQYRTLAHERVLSQEEIDMIVQWVAGNAPEGDPGNAPVPPTYSGNAVITSPDITQRMPDYTVPAITEDLYRAFVVPSGNSIDQFITGMEVLPGNNGIVHHVLVYQDTTGQAQALDDADPDPGYTSFGGIGVSDAKLVGLWVPGAQPWFAPPGMGVKLFANADLVFQVHYPHNSDGQLDSTRINLQLTTAPFTRNLSIDPILEHTSYTMTDGPLIIAPNTVHTFHNQYTTLFPATITGVGPHGHLLCKQMKSWAVTPSNDTIRFIDIPDWDFHWQGLYDFRHPIHLPTGTTLYGEATYDNTTANPDNPNSPPDWVWLGEATTNEMMLFFFPWTIGLPSDTNIVIDDAAHPAHYLDCEAVLGVQDVALEDAARIWPSPANAELNIDWRIAPATLRLIDPQGRTVNELRLATGTNSIDVHAFARGAYIAEMRGDDGRLLHRSAVVLE